MLLISDHKGITACHFPRDNQLVEGLEADFSILRDDGPSKRHSVHSVHHAWCLDLENIKDFL